MQSPRDLLRRAWSFIRHILSIRSLLQWTGIWQVVAAAVPSALLAVGSAFARLPWPVVVLVGLAAFVLILVGWRAWTLHETPTPGPTNGTSLPPAIRLLEWREPDESDPRPEYRTWWHVALMLGGAKKVRVRVFIEIAGASVKDRLRACVAGSGWFRHEVGDLRPGEQFTIPVFLKVERPVTLWVDECGAGGANGAARAVELPPGSYLTGDDFLTNILRRKLTPGRHTVRVIVSLGNTAQRTEHSSASRTFTVE
jgi:hypothetical protein